MCLFELFFLKSNMSSNGYLDVFQSPFEFEITRVDCSYEFPMRISHKHYKPNLWNGLHITYNIREEISDAAELVINLTSYPLRVDSF